MKKLLVILLALVILCSAMTLVACKENEEPEHQHTYAAGWATDAENHWHACTGEGCGEVSEKAPHVYADEAAAACSVCGAARTLPVRYQAKDEAEWNAAFDFASALHFSATTAMGDALGEFVRDGDTIKITGYKIGETGNTKRSEDYYVKDGDAYYCLSWSKDGDEDYYERESISKEVYEGFIDELSLLVLGEGEWADFSYDEAGKKYSNAAATSVHTLTFVGGAISKIEASVKGVNPEDPNATVTSTITFADATVTVPTSHVSIIDAARYENALQFKDEDGKFYNNIDIVFINGTEKAFQYKVTDTAAYKYSTAADAACLETIWTNENGKGVIYTKKDADSAWVRTEYPEAFTDLAAFVLPVSSIENYLTSLPFDSKLTYKAEDHMYHGSYKQTSTRTVEVSMRFEDGKLVRINYEYLGLTLKGTRTMTYGDAVIEIPTATKSIAAVPYDNVGQFLLENATLSEGDNWFMIEVTNDMITTYNDEINGEFTVSESSDAVTLNVTVYDASDNEVTNDAAVGKGQLYCEGVSAGTYYIKITASEAYTGTFSVSFG